TNNIEFLDGLHKIHSPRLLLDGSDIPLYLPDLMKGEYRKRGIFPDPNSMIFILNLQDSAGLINVFKIDRALFKNLFDYHEIPNEKADTLLDSLYDWMDKDNFIRPNGAESDYYLKNLGYSAANRKIDSMDELLLIKGMDKEIFNKIGRFLDFSPMNQGVNPNTMSYELFRLFNGLNDRQIQGILQKRLEKPLEGAAQLTLVSGYNFSTYAKALQFFTSNTTYVKIKAKMDNDRYFYVLFRLDRVGGGGSMRSASPDLGPLARKMATEDFNRY
ncbi:MAG: general secretion pathway protein GspK, partial [bacterium]|nr:general secretion pathway protein GspK [bacterium]